MNQKVCQKCGGEGVIDKKGRMEECTCSVLKRLARSMDAQIRNTRVELHHASHPITDRTKELLYISVAWKDVRPLIKVVMYKNSNKFIRITSDREIRDVGVGSTSRSARGESYTEAIYNNLSDLVSPPDFLIVRLNELAYKNKAAPGLLEEALCYRSDRELPTWVISDKDRPFGEGSYAWSNGVDDILTTAFTHVNIPRFVQEEQGTTLQHQPVSSPSMSDYVPPDPSTEPKISKKKYERMVERREEQGEDGKPRRSLADMFGGGQSKKKFGDK